VLRSGVVWVPQELSSLTPRPLAPRIACEMSSTLLTLLTVLMCQTCNGEGFQVQRCDYLNRYIRATQGHGVFIHITKTGGTSIEHAFGLRGSCHWSAMELRACNAPAFDRALSFAVIRHPLDRAVSLYEYARHGGTGSTLDRAKWQWVAQVDDFGQFVEQLTSNRSLQGGHFATQRSFVFKSRGNDTDHLQVDALLCLDSLEDGLRTLRTLEPRLTTFLASVLQAPHLRVTRHSVNTIDLHTLRQLEHTYGADFQLWYRYCAQSTTANNSRH